ncbi:MAG TPA: very short patch repair endonuclease [Pyrinomonadaceae bacterium]|nr:very short patch repair endonuclease [Pyrinomonadaceae bacterium]
MNKPKTQLTRSQQMALVKSKNTSFEMLLRRELWRRGLRYRANDRTVFGKPDLVFKSKKIAVFVDSEFWHGKDYPNGRNIPQTNREYWTNKIERNIARDKEVNRTLKKEGWKIVRIWSKDLKKNLPEFAEKIYRMIRE